MAGRYRDADRGHRMPRIARERTRPPAPARHRTRFRYAATTSPPSPGNRANTMDW